MAKAHEPTMFSGGVNEIEELFIKYISGDKPKTLKILITGKTGVGKSRLVNALVGEKVANEGQKKDPCTSDATSYQVIIRNVRIVIIVWDSPGLQDGTNKEREYIQDMKKKVKEIDLMIYCVKMDDTRFYEADKKAIKILTDEFGPDIWKNAVVALTFANRVDDPDGEDERKYFKMELQSWKKEFKDYFAAVGVNREVCIPVIPAGNYKKSMRLPDRENWLSDLWVGSFEVMKASARQGMYQINSKALEPTMTSEYAKEIEELFIKHISDDKPKPLKILITGKTGVGKSRLVNALVGEKVAKEGQEKDPCTSDVTSYQVIVQNVRVIVWDSPGLQDGTNKESEYIQDMKKKVKEIDLMIYCVKMDDTRFYEADKKAIKILTDEFGPDIWKNAVVALTFANKVDDPDGGGERKYFKMELQSWKKEFKDYFAAVGVNPEVCIPVIPAGNYKKSMRLPDRENWLSDLWVESFEVMKDSARQGMYQINRNRLRSDDSKTKSDGSAPRLGENDIPSEIPLNRQHQERFWKSILKGFITVCGTMLPIVSKCVLDRILAKKVLTGAAVGALSIASGPVGAGIAIGTTAVCTLHTLVETYLEYKKRQDHL